ncbi:MAG: hypothetical protein ACRD2D_09350, partial [Terriglobales bacterium]
MKTAICILLLATAGWTQSAPQPQAAPPPARLSKRVFWAALAGAAAGGALGARGLDFSALPPAERIPHR